jgi:TolB-like protein/class 3 adenylate cyclase/rhodanese-related sulfurtransferase
VSELGLHRRLAAILAADVVGYSRLLGEDETGTLASLRAHREELIEPKVAAHEGRIVKLMGDGLLAEFPSALEAVRCAVEVQRAMAERNADVPEARQVQFRIGVNLGDVVAEGDDIYGDGINVAARLEELAKPGGICLSSMVHVQIQNKIDVGFQDLGEKELKNIAYPVHVFSVLLDGAETPIPERVKLRHKVTLGQLAGSIFVVLLLVVGGVALWLKPWEPREEPALEANMAFPLPDRPSIAVLPFNNMSEDQSQEYFADGMTEDLITDLSKISGLFVIARNSSFSYKGRQVKVREVAEELGVRYVLEGSVRRAGEQVRINAQLIDATTGGHLWADRYDGTLEDIFDLQDQVTEQIVAALAVSLTGVEQAQQARHDTENAAAHDAYLQGWARYKLLTPKDLAEAVPFFEEALRLDPAYAQAHAALASLYWDVLQNDWAFDLNMPSLRAEQFANTHLEEALKNPIPLAHVLQARMLASWGLYDDAVLEVQQAVALDENDATALAGLAEALFKANRPAEGLDFIEQAMRLDPHHPPSYLIILGAAQLGLEQFDEAATIFERAVKRNPDNDLPWIYLASSYGHLGRIEAADDAIDKANDSRNLVGLGELSLREVRAYAPDPFDYQIDFPRFGSKPVQDLIRAGLTDIPLLKWQYLVTAHTVLGLGNSWFEVEGATPIDVPTAKSFHDRGVPFLDTSAEGAWKVGHIPGAVHLSWKSTSDPRFSKTTLQEVTGFNDKIVFYKSDGYLSAPWEAAKAVAWGYRKVYFFHGGAQAWKDAGHSIETGQ